MKKNYEGKYYVTIVGVVVLYLISVCVIPDVSTLSTVVTTVTTLIAAVAFWMQLKRSENLDEATFIMELNDSFIANDELTKVEHALELFYNQVCDGKEGTLNLQLEREHEDCQRLINYLVYMEGMAALIKRNVMHLGVIDDLFAYRFFVAVNNPVVQQFELLPYANYYQGCFELSEMWSKQWRKKGRVIPMDRYALFECDKASMNCMAKGRR
ncbi:MAG: hypothetical protein IKM13_01945 [Clostridia bacterium]|nr:hypothetical protein [Clostridia bacterium]